MKLVLNASVIVKWLLRDPQCEIHNAEAQPPPLMPALASGDVLQPRHPLAEAAPGMTGLRPAALARIYRISTRWTQRRGLGELWLRRGGGNRPEGRDSSR